MDLVLPDRSILWKEFELSTLFLKIKIDFLNKKPAENCFQKCHYVLYILEKGAWLVVREF